MHYGRLFSIQSWLMLRPERIRSGYLGKGLGEKWSRKRKCLRKGVELGESWLAWHLWLTCPEQGIKWEVKREAVAVSLKALHKNTSFALGFLSKVCVGKGWDQIHISKKMTLTVMWRTDCRAAKPKAGNHWETITGTQTKRQWPELEYEQQGWRDI